MMMKEYLMNMKFDHLIRQMNQQQITRKKKVNLNLRVERDDFRNWFNRRAIDRIQINNEMTFVYRNDRIYTNHQVLFFSLSLSISTCFVFIMNRMMFFCLVLYPQLNQSQENPSISGGIWFFRSNFQIKSFSSKTQFKCKTKTTNSIDFYPHTTISTSKIFICQ